jgi:hypothetical protein
MKEDVCPLMPVMGDTLENGVSEKIPADESISQR